MFPANIMKIKNEEVTKLKPRNKLQPSSSVTSFRSGRYPSLDELCDLKTENISTSTPVIELVYKKL